MTHLAVIVKDDSDYRIAGGRLKVEQGETVRLYNCADDEADIVMEKAYPFGAKFKLQPGKAKTEINLEPGYYPYTVTVGGKPATASRPVIIVYP